MAVIFSTLQFITISILPSLYLQEKLRDDSLTLKKCDQTIIILQGKHLEKLMITASIQHSQA